MKLLLTGLKKMKKVIRYHKLLYSEWTILAAIEAFSPQFSVDYLPETDKHYNVLFQITEQDEQVIGEFDNYIICLENRRVFE